MDPDGAWWWVCVCGIAIPWDGIPASIDDVTLGSLCVRANISLMLDFEKTLNADDRRRSWSGNPKPATGLGSGSSGGTNPKDDASKLELKPPSDDPATAVADSATADMEDKAGGIADEDDEDNADGAAFEPHSTPPYGGGLKREVGACKDRRRKDGLEMLGRRFSRSHDDVIAGGSPIC